MASSGFDGAPGGTERRGRGGWDSVLDTEAYRVSPGNEWRSELWRVAVTQFNQAADVLDLDADSRTRLLEPRRAVVANFPIRRDSGAIQSLTGYRVQHTFALGPTRGGSATRPACAPPWPSGEAARLRSIYLWAQRRDADPWAMRMAQGVASLLEVQGCSRLRAGGGGGSGIGRWGEKRDTPLPQRS